MAIRNRDLDDRRELIAHMVKNANRKISRLQSKGIDIEGTKHDVRSTVSNLSRLNTNQLNAAEKRLADFNSRRNSFVKLADDTVLTGKQWGEFKNLERKRNAKADAWNKSVSGVRIHPDSPNTVGERTEHIKNTRARAQGESTPRLFERRVTKPENVNGLKAVQKLTKQMKNKLKADYVRLEVQKGRKSFNAMLDKMGNSHLTKDLNSLTDHQFLILTKETNFAESLGQNYAAYKQSVAGIKDDFHDSVIDTNSELIRDYLQSAKSYPQSPGKRQQAKKSGARKSRR